MPTTGPWGGGIGSYRVFRVRIQFTHTEQKCSIGFHVRDVGVATLSPLNVAEKARDWANTHFKNILSTTDAVTSIDAVNLETAEGYTIAQNVAGMSTGERAVSGLMFPVTLVGGLRKRYANGRMMWPVAAENAIEGNTMAASAVAAYDAVAAGLQEAFMDDGVTATQRLVHLHAAKPERPGKKGPLPAVPATWYDITAIKINRTTSWLSSRKVGHGT